MGGLIEKKDSQGRLIFQEQRANNLKNGVSTYYKNGVKVRETTYKDDKKIGQEKIYFSDGKVQKVIDRIDEVYFSEYQSFFQNGNLKAKTKLIKKSASISEPDIYSFETFNDRSKLVYKGECAVGLDNFDGENCYLFTGKFHGYNNEDVLIEESQWLLGKLEGISKQTTENEVIVLEYVKNRLTKKSTYDRKSNKLIKTEEYNSDGSRK